MIQLHFKDRVPFYYKNPIYPPYFGPVMCQMNRNSTTIIYFPPPPGGFVLFTMLGYVDGVSTSLDCYRCHISELLPTLLPHDGSQLA